MAYNRRRVSRGTSSASRMLRKTQQRIWLDYVLASQTITGVLSPFSQDIRSNMTTQYDITGRNTTVLRVVGDILAQPTLVSGASTSGMLVVGFVKCDANNAAADLDPTQTSGQQRPWAYQHTWFQQLVSNAAVQNGISYETGCHVDFQPRAQMRSNRDDFRICIGSTAAAGSEPWLVSAHLRVLVLVP